MMPDAPVDPLKDALLDAALGHVPFEGWSPATFKAAVAETGTDPGIARTLCPRGALDLAVAFHERGDREMTRRIDPGALEGMRYRDKVGHVVHTRIEAIEDKEAVRRASTLFAMPMHGAEGARLLWGTADHIWEVLGDKSDDINWYTKRAILSGVYASSILFWLGDDSAMHQATWTFIDRRIDNVMQIEKVKAQVNANPVLSRVLAPANWLAGRIKAPARVPRADLPGSWTGRP